MIEAYRGETGEDFTNGLESLLIKGLENHHTSQLLFKKFKNEADKLSQLQKTSDDRIIKVLIAQMRILGELKALTKVHIIKSGFVSQEEADEYMKRGVKSVFNTFKTGEAV